ncbi:MAG TPA: phasin family protein [Rickettsiales bacterium]|nr:phasin family protein [Rickettsiales bacterium]
MSQAPKKPTHTAHAAPKIVAKSAHTPAKPAQTAHHAPAKPAQVAAHHAPAKAPEKPAKPAMSALESTQNAAKSVANRNADTIKEFFSNNAEEAQKAHARMFALNREGTEVVTRALDALTRTMNDCITLSRESVDVAVEVNNIVNDISRTANAELIKYANNNFADNLDIFNEALGCRNINDALEITNQWISTNINNYFSQAARMADMLFQFASEASEPVNDHILESAERLSKSLAA